MSNETSNGASFSLWRRWGMAIHVGLSALAVLAILGMVNYLASRHYLRFHWTAEGGHVLSPLTQQLVASLTNDVKVVVLFDPEESPLYTEVKNLLTEYQLVNRRVQLEMVDYGRNPGRAGFLKERYRLQGSEDTLVVVFEATGRPPLVVRERQLSEYDLAGAIGGEEAPRRTGFRGEQYFTSALLALSESRALRAYYLTGHGEADLAEESAQGYREFGELLAEKHIELVPLSLRTNGVPEDAQLLVIAGPRSALPSDELARVDAYLKGGGRALMLLFSPVRPGLRRSGLGGLLADWGVEVGDNLVVDPAQTLAGDRSTLLTGQLGSHPIVRPLQGMRLGFVMPQSVRPRPASGRAVDAGRVDELVMTTREGLVAGSARGGGLTAPTNGVICLAVALEKGAIAGVSPDRGATRLVAVGEAGFLSNGTIHFEANRDFAGLAVDWLLDRRQLLNIGPRPIAEYRISLSRRQLRAAAWLLLGVLPGTVLATGLLVWLRRRK